MVKKKEISEIFLKMWREQDQADQQDMLLEALAHMPIEWQKTYIKGWIKNGAWVIDCYTTQDTINEIINEAKAMMHISNN